MNRELADPLPPPPWHDLPDDTLHCVQVRQETADVKTFVFSTVPSSSFRYRPGQFITLELQIDGQPVNRCYTLSSTPTRPDRITISVKRVPGGQVSNWLHEHLKPGDRISALGPAGDFSCFVKPAERYLFLSGGSGITPLMSMTRALHDLASDADVVFVHCARTPADVLFAEELTLLARNMKRFRVAVICEQQPPGSAYAGYLGRIDAAKIAQIAPDFLTRDVYTCGPAPFMGAVRQLLGAAGYDMARYREESFSFETLASAAPAAPAAGGSATGQPAAAEAPLAAAFQITLSKAAKTFACGADQPILKAAQAAGLRLPFSCSDGICGTCKSLKLSGSVDIRHNGGIRQREIDQGWILPCCSRPLSDVTLDR
jgi:ferredoxin-NADP reductase